MFLTILVIVVVSAALVAGAAWGAYGTLPAELESFIVALAGGALIVSAVLELIDPATDVAPVWAVSACVLAGAVAFSGLDRLVKDKFGSDRGGGLLAAITLDGIPENLALGVALIGAGPLQVASLSGSIFLSNLPEAAGALKRWPTDARRSRSSVCGPQPLRCSPRRHWSESAVRRRSRCGAWIDPMRRRRRRHRLPCHRGVPQGLQGGEKYTTGVATALGLVLAIGLDQLG